MKKMRLKGIFFLLLSALVLACDFTPPVNRKIIDAQNFISEQKYAKAAYLYEEILKSHPREELSLKVSYQLGELYSIYLGEYQKSVKYYAEVKELTKDPLWLIKAEEKLAEVYFSYLKNYKEAIKSYTRLIEFTPKLKDYDLFLFRIALSYFYSNNHDLSLEAFTKIQTNPNHEFFIRSFYYVGLIYFEKRDFNKALFVWLEYLKRETKKEFIVEAKFMVANVYEATENLKMAYDIYYSIASDYPNPDVIQNRLNSLYARRVARRR